MTSSFNRYFNWDNIVTYNKRISDHNFTATGVVSYIQNTITDLSASGERQLLASQAYYNLTATQQNRNLGSGFISSNNLSFVGRLNYNYKSKYLLTLSQRADGASRLAPGNKWAYFPVFAAIAWNIAEENFLSSTSSWLSNLKLRASWGEAGNYGIDVYGTQSVIVPAQNIGFGDVQGSMYQFRPFVL